MAKVILDTETGEIERELNIGDKIIPKSQSDGCKKHIENAKQRKKFVSEYGNFIFRLHGENQMESYIKLPDSDMARLAYIATYADYEGILKLDSGTFITKSILFKVMKVDRKIFKKWFTLMTEHGFIIESEDKLLVDKSYYTKGAIKTKGVEYTRIFINAIRNLYESNVGKNMSTIGSVFKLIPFMQFELGVICWNPKSSTNIQLIRMKDVAQILGFNENQIKRCISVLVKYKFNGQQVFRFDTDYINSANDYVKINPRLFYSGNIDNYAIACDYFDNRDIDYLTQSPYSLDTKSHSDD